MNLIRSLSANSHTYYYWYSITHSLFHSRLKTFLFCKSFPPQPFLFFFRTDYIDYPDCLLLLLSISVFTFLFFCFTLFSCSTLHHFGLGRTIELEAEAVGGGRVLNAVTTSRPVNSSSAKRFNATPRRFCSHYERRFPAASCRRRRRWLEATN